jgi:hypothetical protein
MPEEKSLERFGGKGRREFSDLEVNETGVVRCVSFGISVLKVRK